MTSDMVKHVIVGVHITDRVKHVPDIQRVFTEFGCSIKTRLGLHETDSRRCSPNGLVVLEMFGDEAAYAGMVDKLRAIEGVEVKTMEFSHP